MKRADLLALVCDVYCDFVTFPFGILGQVWYLKESISDPCCLSHLYFGEFGENLVICMVFICLIYCLLSFC